MNKPPVIDIDDRCPVGVNMEAQRDADIKWFAESVFPKDYYPSHLVFWAESIKDRQGYESALSLFLSQLATNWQSLQKMAEGE